MPAFSNDESLSAHASPLADRRTRLHFHPSSSSSLLSSASSPPSSSAAHLSSLPCWRSSPSLSPGSSGHQQPFDKLPSLPPLPVPVTTTSTLQTLRRSCQSLSDSQFSLIPEDRAVHITSVRRNGRTYKYRHETSTSPLLATSPIHDDDTVDARAPATLIADEVFFAGDAAATPPTLSSAGAQRYFPTNGRRSLRHALTSLLLWWPLFLLDLVQAACGRMFAATFVEHPYARPAKRAAEPSSSLWAQLFEVVLQLGAAISLNAVKHLIGRLTTSAAERQRPKRTVLISGGRTLQALQLARNFRASGYRVVAADIDDADDDRDDDAPTDADDSLPLCGFSSAVSRYYKLPRPDHSTSSTGSASVHRTANAYIARLCDIVDAEKPVLYVPVCAGTRAHFDALAKPHLVLRGCRTFAPGVAECAVFDDLAALLRECRRAGIAVPRHRHVRSVPELLGVYDDAEWSAAADGGNGGRFVLHAMASADTPIVDGRRSVQLPVRRELVEPFLRTAAAGRRPLHITEQRPVLVVLEPTAGGDGGGGHDHVLVTCTTVRATQVVANVTCCVQPDAVGQPLQVCAADTNATVERWLGELFGALRQQRPIDGHLEFRLVPDASSGGRLVPCGVRVGVPAAYVCHTAVQARVLMPPCAHFSRKRSGPLLVAGARYWLPAQLAAAVLRRRPHVRPLAALAVRRLWAPWAGRGRTDRGGPNFGVLFAGADPLPWLVWCGWQLARTVRRWWRS